MKRKKFIYAYNLEFGYELIAVLPRAYYLYQKGLLEGTESAADTSCLYYFSPRHIENKLPRNYFNIEAAKRSGEFANLDIHKPKIDDSEWCPPPLAKWYQKTAIRFEKQTLCICNRYNQEWTRPPVNFFPLDFLSSFFEAYQDKYQIVYFNIEGRPELYDNAPPITLGDFDLLKQFPGVLNIHDLHLIYGGSFNMLQLRIFAGCRNFLTMNGGYSILASYFGGRNVIYTRKCHELTTGDFGYYPLFGGSKITLTSNLNEVMEKFNENVNN